MFGACLIICYRNLTDYESVKRAASRAGSLQDNNLLATAAELDGYTFYGRFRLDSASRRQVGHRILLIQWVRDHKVLLPTGNIE